MIPLLLEIKNFLSYGEPIQRIDFGPYQLICLSGKNGNGKSALLDAITWAIWGQARKVTGAAKADDGLVRLGQTRMMVSLTFLFNGQKYRVRREYAKSYGKPYAALDFELYDEGKDSYISLTDKTIRATQAKIQSLVGLDFDTFVNSAFIRQGQSNEFSKKSAKERKHILSSILGLGKYDALQQAALEKARASEQEKKILTFNNQQALLVVAQEEGLLLDLASKKTTLEAVTKKVTEQQLAVARLQQSQATCTAALAQYATLRATLTDKKNSIANTKKIITEMAQTWRTVHAQSLHMIDQSKLDAQKKVLTAAEDTLMQKHAQYMLLQQKLLSTQQAHAALQLQIRTQAEKQIIAHTISMQNLALEKRQHETIRQEKMKQSSARVALIAALSADTHKIALEMPSFVQHEAAFLATKNQFDKRRSFYQTLIQRGNWTKQQLADLDRRQLVVDDVANPSCPLCQQLLTVKRKQFLATTFEHEKQQVVHRLQRITKLIAKLKELLVEQHSIVTTMTTQHQENIRKQAQYQEGLKQIVTEQHDLDVIDIELAQLTREEATLTEKLATAQTMLDAITASVEHTVQHDAGVAQLHQAIDEINKELQAINWQDEAYQKLRKDRTQLEALIAKQEQYQEAFAKQRERRLQITQLIKQLKSLLTEEKHIETELLQEEQTKAELGTIDKNMALVNEQLLTHTKEKEALLHSLGRLEQELQAIATTRTAMAETTKKISFCQAQLEQFGQLATAFSKNGIQALLIEEAIPEIENEANILLSRLTDNQAHIFIESLKDLKNGGVKETLDIHIADTAGIRPYELFSGGEAFRVDFALRIAIAKLLARRAGTALQTLIIDEGFGSQDEEGLAHIMEALYAIQQDFAKIIIVSHLPEFKQNFPVHFIVEKGTMGSVVRIEERG